MALILFKWLFIFFAASPAAVHPVYMSVTEIEHNAKERSLEISCKIFTDDFEQTLRKSYKKKVDLLSPKYKKEMEVLVNDYVQKHLKIIADGRPVSFKFLGYEQHEEGIASYYEIDNISQIKELVITDNILYEYKQEQISLIHVTVNGNRKSTKLNNPDDKAIFSF